LSSIGESKWCMQSDVQKLPYTLEAAQTAFDITKPQPQLFVTPHFAHLSQVLEDFANSMALRTGGLEGVQKLISSKALGTLELSTGLQISGTFGEVMEHNGKPIYIKTYGPTALAYRDKELVGHSTLNHADGFGSSIGKLKGINLAIEDMSPRDLKAYKIFEEEQVALEFEGGVKVEGTIVTGTRNLQGKIILITFKDCKVSYQDEVLFLPEWGLYHMAVGQHVVSAYNGPADLLSFDLITHKITETTIKKTRDAQRLKLEAYYKRVRDYRDGINTFISRGKLFEEVKEEFPEDWLLPVELYELARKGQREELATTIKTHLEEVKKLRPEVGHLIDDGLQLIDQSFTKV
ncbi:MAG: aromatic amino acid hydroxylase, partial [Allomuricauda sp.]